MKAICVCALCGVMFILSTSVVQAAYLSYNTISVDIESNPKPNPRFVSKPAYPKYAGVTFITDDDANKFKFDAADVRTQCMALGFAYLADNCEDGTAKALCSSVVNLPGAEKYTSGCCNRKYYSYDDNNQCGNNNTIETCTTASGKNYYHCGCNRSLYPFSGDSDCPRGNVVNMVNSCTTNDENNISTTYYATCCPASYQEVCDGNHQVGEGVACYRKEGESLIAKYGSCSCSSRYDTICIAGGMIDPSDYCLLNGKKFTRESNCEGLCERSSETNVDAEFYNKMWHCLYREDGATIKEPEVEAGLCKKEENDYYYDSCGAQGFTKDESECFNKEAILKCPQNSSRVWCLDDKYCKGYDVAVSDNDYVHKARVEKCPVSDQGNRYRYIEQDCNNCWVNGFYDSSRCENKDKNAQGDGNHCCRLGYVMNDNGICIKNTCDKSEYPYRQHPFPDIGEVEICYEGNPDASDDVNLMYDPYYGYSSCKNDFSQGEMWKHADDNPRKCVCDRDNPLYDWFLPYNNADYVEEERFYRGAYGDSITCTDNEASYYGYKLCYKYSTETNVPGECVKAKPVGYYSLYGYLGMANPTTKQLTPMLEDIGYTPVYECIARYLHYQDANGNRLGDESVAPLLVEGCNWGNEYYCNICYSISNLSNEKTADGLYQAHDKFRLKINWFNIINTGGNSSAYYMEQCPSSSDMEYNYFSTMYTDINGYKQKGFCYKHCKLSDLSKCYLGDILVDDQNGNYRLAIIINTWAQDKRLILQPFKGIKKNVTWHEAMAFASNFYPGQSDGDETYKNHPLVGQGKWNLETKVLGHTAGNAENLLEGSIQKEGLSISTDFLRLRATNSWYQDEDKEDSSKAYYQSAYVHSEDKNTLGIAGLWLELYY